MPCSPALPVIATVPSPRNWPSADFHLRARLRVVVTGRHPDSKSPRKPGQHRRCGQSSSSTSSVSHPHHCSPRARSVSVALAMSTAVRGNESWLTTPRTADCGTSRRGSTAWCSTSTMVSARPLTCTTVARPRARHTAADPSRAACSRNRAHGIEPNTPWANSSSRSVAAARDRRAPAISASRTAATSPPRPGDAPTPETLPAARNGTRSTPPERARSQARFTSKIGPVRSVRANPDHTW